jgi:hypothetical protein
MSRNLQIPNPAQNIVSGTIDKEQTWYQDIEVTQNGSPLTDVDDHTWTLVLYKYPGASADLTLTTTDSTLTITEAATTLLGIRCASTRLAALCGDYLCDVISEDPNESVDGEDRKILRARGTVTVTEGAA